MFRGFNSFYNKHNLSSTIFSNDCKISFCVEILFTAHTRNEYGNEFGYTLLENIMV